MKSTQIQEIEGEGLIPFGMVRVDGLTLYWSGEGEIKSVVLDNVKVRDCGFYGTNNGAFVAITNGGEVWLGMGQTSFEANHHFWQALEEVCSKSEEGDQGLRIAKYVVPTGAEYFKQHHLLHRLRNPSWDPEGDEW